MITKEIASELIRIAIESMQQSYSPYSGFRVGAALLAKSGKVYTGANIENSAYSPSVCAERVAFFKAISEGEHAFTAIAVAGGRDGKIEGFCDPCGVCRQVMAEFCDKDFEIVTISKDDRKVRKLAEILPDSFILGQQ